jgi:hypothetical protein
LGVGGCNVLAGIGDLPYPPDASDAGGADSTMPVEDAQSTPDATDAGSDATDAMAHDETGSATDAGDGGGAVDGGSSDAIDETPVTGWDGAAWDAGTVDLASAYFVQVNDFIGSVPDGSTLGGVVDLPNDVTAHDTLIVAADFTTAVGPTITDNLGNTFVRVGSPFADGVGTWAVIWYVADAKPGHESLSASLANVAAGDFLEVYLHEYRGLHGFDHAAAMTGTSMAVSSGQLMTSQSNDLLFAYVATGSAGTADPFFARSTDNANLSEDTLAGVAGLYQARAVMVSGSGWIMVAASFKTH